MHLHTALLQHQLAIYSNKHLSHVPTEDYTLLTLSFYGYL